MHPLHSMKDTGSNTSVNECRNYSMTHDKQQSSGYDRIQDSRKKFMIKRIKRCHEKSCGFNVEYLSSTSL